MICYFCFSTKAATRREGTSTSEAGTGGLEISGTILMDWAYEWSDGRGEKDGTSACLSCLLFIMFENIAIERRVRWQEMAKQKQEELLQEQRSISAVLESYAQERLANFLLFCSKTSCRDFWHELSKFDWVSAFCFICAGFMCMSCVLLMLHSISTVQVLARSSVRLLPKIKVLLVWLLSKFLNQKRHKVFHKSLQWQANFKLLFKLKRSSWCKRNS